MKRANIILLIILLSVTTESIGQREAVNNDLITVDVRKTYSQKKELILQDFMDVEYIVLETKDDFLNQGIVMDIGKEIIIVKNIIDDGNIFIYNINGKALRKINRKGQGTEEYLRISGITLDESNNEMFVNVFSQRKIFVYDLYGKFKRSFKHKEGAGSLSYIDIFNYDKENLICYDKYNEEIAFVLISKHNGNINKEIKIPFKEKKLLQLISSDGTTGVAPGPYSSIIPDKGNWRLLEVSSDTIYSFLPNYSLKPFMVRAPSVQSMNPEVMLLLRLISDRYYFMETIKMESSFPRTFMMYDMQAKSFSGYTLFNGDYSNKKEIYLNALRPVNHEIESWQPIEAYQLVEDYKEGRLKNGKLKEIALKLDVEDNPVIMLIKHKKN